MTIYNDFDGDYSEDIDEYVGDDLSYDTEIQKTTTYLYKTFGIVPKRTIEPLKITDDWLHTLAYIQKIKGVPSE